MSDLGRILRGHAGSGLVHWGADADAIAQRVVGQGYMASPVTQRFVEPEAPWFVAERLMLECALDLDALAAAGVSVVSPALQGIAQIGARGGGWLAGIHGPRGVNDHGFWMRLTTPLLAASRFVVVVDRPGWDRSRGIAAEVEYALGRNMPVFVMVPGFPAV